MIRQVVGFGLVGGLQLLLDWACFVALTALGVAVLPANLVGRVAGASLGFWANGRFTFARPGEAPRLGRRRLLRFVLFWLAMTALSTLAVMGLDQAHSLQAAWLGKPLVDAVLAALGFLAAKYWIYR
ncbi:membrane protein [Arenimonas soli]|uniref:Membrane protein n=1 Tax=Arenimonas soli TaxID=2269504 RepID=A0ABQ1H9I8_9GAMM|nr:GtrA family protein [Arenimonas soli]GGA66919.1 membrane protein [Arenimonas soli]